MKKNLLIFFFPPFVVSCEKLMAHQVKGCHSCLSLYSNERNTSPSHENWQPYRITAGGAAGETLLDRFFSMLGNMTDLLVLWCRGFHEKVLFVMTHLGSVKARSRFLVLFPDCQGPVAWLLFLWWWWVTGTPSQSWLVSLESLL